MKPLAYIKLHWRGELPFDLAYLANYLLVTAIVAFGLWQLQGYIDWNGGLLERGIFVYSVCFALFIFSWSAVGVVQTLLKMKDKPWIFVAYIIFALSAFRYLRFVLKLVQSTVA